MRGAPGLHPSLVPPLSLSTPWRPRDLLGSAGQKILEGGAGVQRGERGEALRRGRLEPPKDTAVERWEESGAGKTGRCLAVQSSNTFLP